MALTLSPDRVAAARSLAAALVPGQRVCLTTHVNADGDGLGSQAGLAHLLRARHGWNWGELRRHLRGPDGRWRIAADGVEYFRIQGVTVSRYTYRGNKIPTPWPTTNPA